MHPRQFLIEFVEPAIADWIARPMSARHAILALCEIDNLAEHFIQHTKPGVRIAAGRDLLGSNVQELAMARDVHDTHKHGALGRKTATITQGQKPKQSRRGGAFSEAFSSGFQIGDPALVVVEDNQTLHYVDDLIERAVKYWRAEIAKLSA